MAGTAERAANRLTPQLPQTPQENRMAGKWADAADELQGMLDNGATVEEVEEVAARKLNELLDEG